MGKGPLRLLAVWVFLSALFITSSLAAASSEGDVYCIVRPNFPYLFIYLTPKSPDAPAIEVNNTRDEYICTGPIPHHYLSRGAELRFILPGFDTITAPTRFARYDLNQAIVTRLAYVAPESNRVVVVYTASGVGYIVVDENIPKFVVGEPSDLVGDFAFLELDPIIRMHLRAENGKLDVAHYSIMGVSEIPETDVKVGFASCALRVGGISATVTRIGEHQYVVGRFVLLDGNTPIVVPNLKVRVGDKMVSPQYSSSDRSYQFFAPYRGKDTTVKIVADVPGCSHFEHVEYLKLEKHNRLWGAGLVFILVAVLAAGAYLFKMRRR